MQAFIIKGMNIFTNFSKGLFQLGFAWIYNILIILTGKPMLKLRMHKTNFIETHGKSK